MISRELPLIIQNSINAVITSECIISPFVQLNSDTGGGCAAEIYDVSVKGSNKSVELFIKHLPSESDLYDKVFRNELRFYEEIYPAVVKFQKEWCVEGPFENVPRSYHVKVNHQGTRPVILENLKRLKYILNTKPDNAHISLVIKTYAKYHATSFAMKVQRTNMCRKFSTNVDIFDVFVTANGLKRTLALYIDKFVENLHPVDDKKMISACKNLADTLMEYFLSTPSFIDNYACLCHGDTRLHNMMFLYNEFGSPIDVKLIDWQLQRYHLPTMDLVYFIYTSVANETLSHIDDYLKLYYDSLCDHIKKLGSDPDQLYPYNIFIDHWKKSRLMGLLEAFIVRRIQLADLENIPDLIKNQDEGYPFVNISDENLNEYQAIMKNILQHFIDSEIL